MGLIARRIALNVVTAIVAITIGRTGMKISPYALGVMVFGTIEADSGGESA